MVPAKNSSRPSPTQLDRALAYAAADVPVFPCGASKKPLTLHGFKDASTDPAQIRAWWNDHPRAEIGIPTGAGLLVVDEDLRGGPEPLAPLEAQHGALPPTRTIPTRSGGRHRYFRSRADMSIRTGVDVLAYGVDVRADGGYVIAWADDDTPIADAPAWLLERLTTPKRTRPAGRQDDRPAPALIDAGGPIPEGSRNATLASRAGRLRRQGADEPAMLAALLRINAEQCRPPLEDAEVERIAASIAGYPAGPRRVIPTQAAEEPAPFVPAGETCDAKLATAMAEIARLTARAERAEAEAAQYRAWFNEAEARAARAHELQSRTVQIVANKSLGQKRLAAPQLLHTLESAAQEGKEWARSPLKTLAEGIGASEKTVSRYLQQYEAAGLIVRDVRDVPEQIDPETGEITPYHSELYIKPAVDVRILARKLATAPDPGGQDDRPQWGGKRIACDKHPGAAVVKRTVWSCGECGDVLDSREVAFHPAPGRQDDRSETATATGGQLDRQKTKAKVAVLTSDNLTANPRPGGHLARQPLTDHSYTRDYALAPGWEQTSSALYAELNRAYPPPRATYPATTGAD